MEKLQLADIFREHESNKPDLTGVHNRIETTFSRAIKEEDDVPIRLD